MPMAWLYIFRREREKLYLIKKSEQLYYIKTFSWIGLLVNIKIILRQKNVKIKTIQEKNNYVIISLIV